MNFVFVVSVCKSHKKVILEVFVLIKKYSKKIQTFSDLFFSVHESSTKIIQTFSFGKKKTFTFPIYLFPST